MTVTKSLYWIRQQTIDWRRKQNQAADRMFLLASLMVICTIGFLLRLGHLGYTVLGLPKTDLIDIALILLISATGLLTIAEALYYKKCKQEYQTAKAALIDRLATSPCTCTTYCTCAEDFIEDTYKKYKINLYY